MKYFKACTRAVLSVNSPLFFRPRKREIEDSIALDLNFFEPVGRDQELADIRGGQYFGEIAFTVMVKKMLQVPREVMLRSSNTSMWLNLLVFLTSEEICRTQMIAGSLRSK